MSNDESPDKPQQLSNDNTKLVDTTYPKDANVATIDRMAVVVGPHTAPRASRAHPFSGSLNQMTGPKTPAGTATPHDTVHPTNDTSSCHHVPHHIRTNANCPESPSAPPMHCNTVEEDVATPQSRMTHQLAPSITNNNNKTCDSQKSANQAWMDPRKSATTRAVVNAFDIMSLGDNNTKNNKDNKARTNNNDATGVSDSSRSHPILDDGSDALSKGGTRKRSHKLQDGQTAGRWTPEEHQDFLEGLKIFGREWKKVAERIPTRTSAQIRSHAQKYFSKLARDESIMLQDHQAAAAAAAVTTQHQTSTSMPIVPETTSAHLSESVQRSVNRILANPASVEREVEDTLRELRERYVQLQIRLEEANRRQSDPQTSRTSAHIVESDGHHHLPDIPRQPRQVKDRRKRPLEEWSVGSAQRINHDDISSVSSAGFSPTRELGDEELIALSVLGGSLPRSSSQQELDRSASVDENSRQDALRQARNSSPTSTIGSNREGPEDMDDRSDQAKKLKLSDEDTDTTNNNTIAEDGDSLNRDDMVL